jgi:DNA-binding transcriptional LysR family regulator
MAAPDHPLAGLATLSIADLSGQPAILPETGTYTHTLIAQAFARHGLTLRARLQTNYMETIRMMVTVGLGWSLLPTTLAGPDLVGLDVPGLALHRQLGLVRHRDRSPSRAMAAFCDLLRAPPEVPPLP